MKNLAFFSSKDKSKKLKCLLQFLFGTLRVKQNFCVAWLTGLIACKNF